MEENTMRTVTRFAIAGSVVVGAVAILWPGTTLHAAPRRQVTMAARRARHLRGRLHGALYRLQSRRPDPNVTDLVLTDRIRSSLGPLEKRLDVPHLHVMVEDHVALLHGAVPTTADAEALEHAVEAISGVRGVESYLHVGLGASDTRPSAGRDTQAHEPSAAMRQLLDAAISAGLDEDVAVPVVRGVLATFAERLPVGERRHVAAHLPDDVKARFVAPRRRGSTAPARHVDDLIARIMATTTDLPRDHAAEVTVAVLRALRSLVHEETAGVAAVLPVELRQLWQEASPVSS
jgi:uncharacterized protein (DUF2267 family)